MKKLSDFTKQVIQTQTHEDYIAKIVQESYEDLTYNIPDKDFTKLTLELNKIISNSFTFYVKLKGIHWHVTGNQFLEFHKFTDEYSQEVFETIDTLAERVRGFNMNTIVNISQIATQSEILQNNDTKFDIIDKLGEILMDTIYFIGWCRNAQNIADDLNDGATSNILQEYIEQYEKRKYLLNSITNKF